MASSSKAIDRNTGWIGNGPKAKIDIGTITCYVDENPDRPWYIKNKLWMKINIKEISPAHGGTVDFWCDSCNGYNLCFLGSQITWHARNNNILGGSTSSDSGWHEKEGGCLDIRQILGSDFKSHTWYSINCRWYYAFTHYIHTIIGGWQPGNVYQTYLTSPSGYIYTPRVCGGNRKNWTGKASPGSNYAYRSVYFSASYSGFIKGNESHTVTFKVGGTTIGSQTNQTSGTISGYKYISGPGNQRWSLSCDGYEFAGNTWYFQDPPPSKPIMGSVNNTTAQSINTTQSKTISANWYRSDVGWPQGTVTYNWECYYGGTRINSGETTDTSVSFTYNIPNQNSGDNVYFRVRAKQNSNSLGYSDWMNSSSVLIFWAYNEPAKVSAVSLSPTRFQLFYGNKTGITTNATMKINNWGDRPGTRNVEFRMIDATKNQHVAWYGRNNTGETGNYSQTLTATIPDANLNDTYEVWAHKRIGDTEYLVSSDPRYPQTGTNNAKVGSITFYEVKGAVSGSFRIDPNIIISGLSSSVEYEWTYDRQSSNKVDIYLEVYNLATSTVTKTFNFETDVNESKHISNRRSGLILIEAQKAGSYEVRLKAKVTELLGNITIHTLATIQPENYNPPIPRLSVRQLSQPLPTTKAAALLGKQATDIAWDYSYSFEGVEIRSAEIEVNSKPYGKQVYSVPSSSSSSPYYGNYNRVSTGEFDLDSNVTATLRVYYAITGDSRIWTVESDVVTVKITHTRYMFYYTTTELGEKQMIQMRYLNSNTDKVLKKIYIDS